jgi:hypothetical protein
MRIEDCTVSLVVKQESFVPVATLLPGAIARKDSAATHMGEATTASDFVHVGETGCLSRLMELLISPYKHVPPKTQ